MKTKQALKLINSIQAPVTIGAGWFNILQEGHNQIMNINPSIEVLSVTSSYGALSYNYANTLPSTTDKIAKIIQEMKDKSLAVSELSGLPANTYYHKGRYHTVTEDEIQQLYPEGGYTKL